MADEQPAAPAAPETKPAPAPSAPAAPATAASPAPAAPAKEPDWREDWRDRMSGGDADELKQLGRYASPIEVWKKARSLERRMSSGELKPVLPKDAKPDDLAAWRKDNGIPDTSDKYDLAGIEVPKEDADLIKGVLEKAHGAHYTPAQAKVAVQAYYDIQKSVEKVQAEQDETDRGSAIDELAAEWGGKFSGYKNRIGNFLSMFPEGVRDALMNARMPDGTAVFNSPDVLRTIVALSLKDIPDGVHVPSEGGDAGKGAVEEYRGLQKLMREDRKAYDKDPKNQDRFLTLITYLRKHEMIDEQGNEISKQKKAA